MPYELKPYNVSKSELDKRLAMLSDQLSFDRPLFFVTRAELVAYACYDECGKPKIMSNFINKAEMLNTLLAISFASEIQTINKLLTT